MCWRISTNRVPDVIMVTKEVVARFCLKLPVAVEVPILSNTSIYKL